MSITTFFPVNSTAYSVYVGISSDLRIDNVAIAHTQGLETDWLELQRVKALEYTEVVGQLDKKACELVGEINVLKDEYQALNAAFIAGGWDASTYLPDADALEVTDGAVSAVGIATTTIDTASGNRGCTCATWDGQDQAVGNVVPAVPATCVIIAVGQVRKDMYGAFNYPKIESLDTSAAWYRDEERDNQITADGFDGYTVDGNLGIGITGVNIHSDGTNNTKDPNELTTSTTYGAWYFLKGVPVPEGDPPNPAYPTNIVAKRDAIIAKRNELNTYLNGTDGTQYLRTLRHQEQVNLWYETKGHRDTNLFNYQDALDTAENSAGIIRDY